MTQLAQQSKPVQTLGCRILDRRGGVSPIEWSDVAGWRPEAGVLWVHLDIEDADSREWLRSAGGISESIADALLAGETRSRFIPGDDGLLVVLRGVNTNPGEDPEDMVSIRIWLEKDRIISTRRRRLLSVVDVLGELEAGRGPRSPGEFLADLVGRLADRIGGFVDGVEERLSTAEEAVETESPAVLRREIGLLRRQIASVRRFLTPQRDALDRLYRQSGTWFATSEVQYLREEADRITRHLEDLDLVRERSIVLQEELLGQIAQEQNARMYVLSVVAAIFLPLTFVTGLLGMNVGGLPGLEDPRGFIGSVVVMIVVTAALVAFFRWKRWL